VVQGYIKKLGNSPNEVSVKRAPSVFGRSDQSQTDGRVVIGKESFKLK